MENTLVFYIECSKKEVKRLKKEIEKTANDYSEMWLKGALATEETKLTMLENLLNEQQMLDRLSKFTYEIENYG
ncbi:hypothetical protein [Priestia megaterium]|uniref:hypothetical protein n=1 Tax=Priestia megaterium TaxID=1404 RepID=UPI0013625B9C|nr:hypothetical protein [Priestia megaterium]